MNNREVYIVTDDDEIYLGTVGKITGAGGMGDPKLGQGISAAIIISDIVSGMVFNSEADCPLFDRTIIIRLREPRSV